MIKKYIKETLKCILRSRFFVKKYVNEIEEMYEMTPEKLRKRNEERFLYIFRKAWNNSVYYADLCKSRGGIY